MLAGLFYLKKKERGKENKKKHWQSLTACFPNHIMFPVLQIFVLGFQFSFEVNQWLQLQNFAGPVKRGSVRGEEIGTFSHRNKGVSPEKRGRAVDRSCLYTINLFQP